MSSKTSTLNVRINSDLKQKIVQDAQKLGMTVTEYIEFVLNKTDSVNSESVLSESLDEKLQSIFESNPVLDEIKKISYQNFQKNLEILKCVSTSQKENIVTPVSDQESIIDEPMESKLFELLEVMKGQEIRYELDGESVVGEANTQNDVLHIIINNYHSLIFNK